MTRYMPAAPVAVLSFAAILTLAAYALRSGFLPDDTVTLWASAVAAGGGQVPLGRIVAAYPTIPFLATTLLEFLLPDGTPAPALLAALLLSLIAARWLTAFRASGLGIVAALSATVLTAFHPALIRAAIAGPADMFLAVFLFMLARGLYDLRAQSAAPEVMTVALALLGLAFSHPMGAAVAIASLPFLVFAVRPALAAKSAFNLVIALIFPTVFCVGAFAYVSWVFPGSGWSFLTAPAASLAAWAAGLAHIWGQGVTGSLALDAGLTLALSLVLGAPAAAVVLAWVRLRRPLVAPALVLGAATVFAAMIAVTAGVFGEPVALLVVAPILAAIVILRIRDVRERFPVVIALLVVGWFGGMAGVVIVDPRIATHARDLVNGSLGDRERLDALNLGNATVGREGVLVDSFNAPAVVLGRGRARGLHAPQGEAFALTMLLARIDAPFVALPDPNSAAGAQDQLNKVFPKLYRSGIPGYRVVYQNATWRLFERLAPARVPND